MASKLPSSTSEVRLITIPHSTYCEAARWALQAAGIPYREETFVFCSKVASWVPAATSIRAMEPATSEGRVRRQSQSIPVGLFEGRPDEENIARRDKSMVPVALTPDGQILGDSFEICEYSAKNSNIRTYSSDWKGSGEYEGMHVLDVYGAAVRNLCYAHFCPALATESSTEALVALNQDFYFCVGDEAFLKTMSANLAESWDARSKIFATMWNADEHAMTDSARTLAVVDSVFKDVETRLGSNAFLGGATPGADDIMFASHSSWLLFPPEFGQGTCTRWPSVDLLPSKFRSLCMKYRTTPPGELAMRLYSQERDFGAVRNLMLEPTDPALYPTPPGQKGKL